MLLFKKKYYLFVENTRDFNLNLIKIRGKFHIIYRNIKSKEKIDTLRVYRNNCKKNNIMMRLWVMPYHFQFLIKHKDVY